MCMLFVNSLLVTFLNEPELIDLHTINGFNYCYLWLTRSLIISSIAIELK